MLNCPAVQTFPKIEAPGAERSPLRKNLGRPTTGGSKTLKFQKLNLPTEGQRIAVEEGKLRVPSNPIIPFIEGDGTGPDLWRAARPVFETAVEKAYAGKRKVAWFEVFAGEKARERYGEWLAGGPLE